MSERGKELRQGIRASALVKNPVLFEVVGVAPVAAMAVSLKSAIMLAAVSCAELIIIELFACLALRKVKSYFRMPIYAVLGMAINIPFFMFFEHFTPNEANAAGIFLPLLAVNSLIALHCERFAVKNTFKSTFVDAVSASAGYAFVVLIVGIVREIIGNGTIYSWDLNVPVKLSGFLMPFGGFLLLGFFAAAVKGYLHKKHPDANPENAFRMQEISQSHIGKLKSLLEEDFNPYGEESTAGEDAMAVPQKDKKAPKAKKEKKAKHGKAERVKRSAKKSAPTSKAETNAQELPAPTERARRAERDDYLLDFDDMLSELESFKQKQQESAEGTKEPKVDTQAATEAEPVEKTAITEETGKEVDE